MVFIVITLQSFDSKMPYPGGSPARNMETNSPVCSETSSGQRSGRCLITFSLDDYIDTRGHLQSPISREKVPFIRKVNTKGYNQVNGASYLFGASIGRNTSPRPSLTTERSSSLSRITPSSISSRCYESNT